MDFEGHWSEGQKCKYESPVTELYSARVLDDDGNSPISRVIEAIYWAIEKDVDIINISFGTQEYSAALEKAVTDAENAGILIVAAAGNNETVEYPAAYEEVIAVGSVNSECEISDFSATGEEIELVAPGETVKVADAFNTETAVSGTSVELVFHWKILLQAFS